MRPNRFVKTAAVVAALGMILPYSPKVPAETVNDPKYDAYVNMNVERTGHARYVVPNLYRGDVPYSNVKAYPLVVSCGVEYFPVDIFAQYSYLDVVYDNLGYGFYISNTKNGSYISFDIQGDHTSTDKQNDVDAKSEVFYSTHYVPAAVVCAALGLTFETYDDPENGIRAARVADANVSYSLNDLIVMYSPVKKTDTVVGQDDILYALNEDMPDVDMSVSDDDVRRVYSGGSAQGTTAAQPAASSKPAAKTGAAVLPAENVVKKTSSDRGAADNPERTVMNADRSAADAGGAVDDPFKSAAVGEPFSAFAAYSQMQADRRLPTDDRNHEPTRVFFVVADVTNGESPDEMLTVFSEARCGAMFVLDPALENAIADGTVSPSFLRRVIAAGSTLGLRLAYDGQDARTALDTLEQTNRLLWLITKTKARFVVADGLPEDAALRTRLAESGYILLDGQSMHRPDEVDTAATLIEDAAAMTSESASECLRVDCGEASVTFIRRLLRDTEQYAACSIGTPDIWMPTHF